MSRPLSHIAIAGVLAESVRGDEASPQPIPLSIHLLPAHKYISGGESTADRYPFLLPSDSSASLPSPPTPLAFAMAHRGAQASGTRVLDFVPSNVYDVGKEVA